MISFIIPVYNSEKTIKKCIESIVSQGIKEKQIIVVDNNSIDNSPAIIKEFKEATCLFEKKQGPAAARNRGLLKAEGEFIAFIDSDVVLPKDWAVEALKLLKRDETLGGVGGPGISVVENYISKSLDALLFGKSVNVKEVYVNSLATMDILYRKEAIFGLKFNEDFNFPAGEDVEFNFGVIKKGFKLLHSRDLFVYHYHPIKLMDLIKRWYIYGKHYTLPYTKYPEFKNKEYYVRVLFMPIFLALILLSLFSRFFGYLAILQILLLFSVYVFIGLKIRGGLLFPFVHTIKQFAQVLGISVTSIERITKKIKKNN